MTNAPFSVVVLTSLPTRSLSLALSIQDVPGATVVVVDRLDDLAAVVADRGAVVVVGDEILVEDGGATLARLRTSSPGIGIVVAAEGPSLLVATLVLRARVDEFFPGTASDDAICTAIETVAADVHERLRSTVERWPAAPLEPAVPA